MSNYMILHARAVVTCLHVPSMVHFNDASAPPSSLPRPLVASRRLHRPGAERRVSSRRFAPLCSAAPQLQRPAPLAAPQRCRSAPKRHWCHWRHRCHPWRHPWRHADEAHRWVTKTGGRRPLPWTQQRTDSESQTEASSLVKPCICVCSHHFTSTYSSRSNTPSTTLFHFIPPPVKLTSKL